MIPQFSHSSLDTFAACPRRFKFRHLDKVQLPMRVTADLFLGNAAHKTLAALHQRAFDGITWPLEQMLAFYRSEWETPQREYLVVTAEHMAVDDYIRVGHELLTAYYRKYQPFTSGQLYFVEKLLSTTLSGTSFRITGKIDRLWKRPDGVVEICDYKTGRYLSSGRQDPVFSEQMGIYHLLVAANYAFLQPLEVAEYYLRFDEIVHYRFQPDDLEELTEQIRVRIVEMHNAERLDNFPATEGEHCRFCEYVELCPAKRHARLLMQEAGSSAGSERTTAESTAALADQYLRLDADFKHLKAEHDALREDIIRAAKDLSLEKLVGELGAVKVKLTNEEKFNTKTDDPQGYADLSHTAQELKLDDCFTLDLRLLTDRYKKERLTPDQRERLQAFLVAKESSTVRVLRLKTAPDEDLE